MPKIDFEGAAPTANRSKATASSALATVVDRWSSTTVSRFQAAKRGACCLQIEKVSSPPGVGPMTIDLQYVVGYKLGTPMVGARHKKFNDKLWRGIDRKS